MIEKNMIETILTGIVIGVLVSAPMGPLGVLCIQRTLKKGRLVGFITGLGATTSDLIYAILVGFSMNFIINFIEQHRLIIQILGSIVLLIFGYITFIKKERLSDEVGTASRNYLSSFSSAFGLCFSNPAIIFLFIGLFARFKFFSPNSNIYEVLISLSTIIAGALLWWLTLTSIVGIFRNKVNTKSLTTLNKITGIVLMIIAFVGIVISILDAF
ncbi:MAG: lysine transporter LysE [Bacteroidales bacterium]|nr:MAG: lysine transporter LysE [Bacteroidales bacterium]